MNADIMHNANKQLPVKKGSKQYVLKWIKIIAITYVAIGGLLYAFQEKLLFHPEKLPRNYQFNFSIPFEEVNIAFNETDTLNMVKFFPPDSARRGIVLYWHGNKQNIVRYAKFVQQFTQHGYEVWMEDYPGYGKSTGKRTEQKLYEQAMHIYTLARQKYGNDSIILYGKSLGTGIASYVAAQTNCKRLILETPYYSIPVLFSCFAPVYPAQYMAVYKLPIHQYLQKVNYPVSIFHGTNDWVVPYRCAAKLKTVLKSTDEFITVKKGTHHNLYEFEVYRQKMDSLLQLR